MVRTTLIQPLIQLADIIQFQYITNIGFLIVSYLTYFIFEIF